MKPNDYLNGSILAVPEGYVTFEKETEGGVDLAFPRPHFVVVMLIEILRRRARLNET